MAATKCELCDFKARGGDQYWQDQRMLSHMLEKHSGPPTILPPEPQSQIRCLAGDCGWWVTGPIDDALADYERHAVSMHGGKPLGRIGVPPADTEPAAHWKVAYESMQVQRDRLLEERDRLAAEVTRLEHIADRPSTAVTVVHPNDEINAVLDLLERYPHMGDFRVLAVKGESLKVERAARRWRDAIKEQAG